MIGKGNAQALLWLLLIVSFSCGSPGALSGRFIDGTEFSVSGVSGLPEDQEIGVSHGLIVVDTETGSIPLGEMTFSRLETAAQEDTSVGWLGQQLRIFAGEWFVGVDVYDEALQAVGPENIRRAISPSTVDGYLVLDLTNPLRFQEPLEIKGQLSVHFSNFVVYQGCPLESWPAQRGDKYVTCSLDGSLMLEVAADATTGDEKISSP